MHSILRAFVGFWGKHVEETAAPATVDELNELRKRAKRACDEAQQLLDDYRFIISWSRMQPRYRVRPSPMLDAND
jgi:hypothetical protein